MKGWEGWRVDLELELKEYEIYTEHVVYVLLLLREEKILG